MLIAPFRFLVFHNLRHTACCACSVVWPNNHGPNEKTPCLTALTRAMAQKSETLMSLSDEVATC